ncbi:MAG: hypothetical protein RJA36_2725 [Pseudomonadota bacterium]
MKPIKLLVTFLWLLCAGMAWAQQDAIHHGPSLDVQVQRGNARLPLALVNRLRSGDKVLVRPDLDTLAKGDWVLLLARVSPTGNQVESRHFDVRELKDHAALEIAADNQVPVILLAPQLRNLFGLYTSLSDSAGLLDEVLRADPQRFYDLQKVDQINQAIQTIGRALARSVSGRKPEDAIQATKQLAARFGVSNLDPECFKNQAVNTECVANSIVTNKDFSLPSASDLTAMVGNKSAVDLNSFLVANLRLISQASEYLGSKYRDSYDFAPTFGRRQQQTPRIELFSLARFKSGSVKTAYIYVPSWFSGATPALRPDEQRIGCYSSGRLDVLLKGRLPLASYWHDWRMTVSDPETQQTLGEVTDVALDQELGRFSFDPPEIAGARSPRANQVEVELSGQFGFDTVSLGPVRMALPWQDATTVTAGLGGLAVLISGEPARLWLRSPAAAACVNEMALALPDGVTARSAPEAPVSLEADLSQVAPGVRELSIRQAGAPPLAVAVKVLQPRARIERIEHAEWDDSIMVFGQRLERIARIELGAASCSAGVTPEAGARRPLKLACQGDIRNNARLPDQVLVFHRDDEPAAIRVPLTRIAAKPRLRVAPDAPNALLVSPSPKAMQWNLAPGDAFVTEDSGLSLLLQAESPYTLAKGNYILQLRFQDDPRSASQPISAPLIADFGHNELRTRNPVSFQEAELPSVVNPLEYRVLHQPSEQAGDWRPLQRSVLLLPDLVAMSCSPSGDAWWVQGRHLDLIDGVRVQGAAQADAAAREGFAPARLVPCSQGLCLSLPRDLPGEQVQFQVRWVDDRVFSVRLPRPGPSCAEPSR